MAFSGPISEEGSGLFVLKQLAVRDEQALPSLSGAMGALRPRIVIRGQPLEAQRCDISFDGVRDIFHLVKFVAAVHEIHELGYPVERSL